MTYAREMATRVLSVVEGKVPRYPPATFTEAEKIIAEVVQAAVERTIERCAQEAEAGPVIGIATVPYLASMKASAARIRALKAGPIPSTEEPKS